MRKYVDLNDYELVYLVKENDDSVRDIIYKKYEPLILSLSKKYYYRAKDTGIEFDDYVQEGFFGLFLAIKNYTEESNCMFYTFAYSIINNKMRSLYLRHKSNKEKALNDSISLNTYVTNELDCELIDLIEDKNSLVPDKEIEKIDLYDKLKTVLYNLPFDYSIVLELKINGFNNTNISELLDLNIRQVAYICKRIRKRIISLKKYF